MQLRTYSSSYFRELYNWLARFLRICVRQIFTKFFAHRRLTTLGTVLTSPFVAFWFAVFSSVDVVSGLLSCS